MDNEDLIEDEIGKENEPDDEIKEIMENQDVDVDEAEGIRNIMEEYDLDEGDAVELKDLFE